MTAPTGSRSACARRIRSGSTATPPAVDSTDNPNEFTLLDLTPLVPHAGGYVHPLTGNSDFGPYPADMPERDAFRGPGFWNVDFVLSKRVRFGIRAVQFRAEAYNLFNHANMYPRADTADVSASDFIGVTRTATAASSSA